MAKAWAAAAAVLSAIASTAHPFTAATVAPTNGNSAGSLGRPLCGTGARNGLSVYTNNRSSGQRVAASRMSDALLKVMMPLNDTNMPERTQRSSSSGPPVKQ